MDKAYLSHTINTMATGDLTNHYSKRARASAAMLLKKICKNIYVTQVAWTSTTYWPSYCGICQSQQVYYGVLEVFTYRLVFQQLYMGWKNVQIFVIWGIFHLRGLIQGFRASFPRRAPWSHWGKSWSSWPWWMLQMWFSNDFHFATMTSPCPTGVEMAHQ